MQETVSTPAPMSPQPPSIPAPLPKKKSPLGLVLGLMSGLIVLILVGAIAMGYFLVYVPGQVAKSMNTNIEVVNGLNEDTKTKLEPAIKKLEEASNGITYDNAEDFDQVAKAAQDVVEPAQQLATSHTEAKDKLIDGVNEDTKDFKDSLVSLIDARSQALKTTANGLEYVVCVGNAASAEIKATNDLSTTLRGFSITNSLESMKRTTTTARQQMETTYSKIEAYEKCFDKNTLNLDLEKAKREVTNYKNSVDIYIRSYKLLEEAITQLNTGKVTEAQNLLKQADTNAEKSARSALKETLEQASNKVEDAYRNANKEFEKADTKRKDIYKKYNISDTAKR